MAGKSTFKPNYKGIGQLMNSPAMVELVRQRAEAAMAYAESISPERTGEYKASFEVTAGAHGGPKNDRAEARLTNTSPHAVDVEWKDGYHVLNRTASALGTL
jgi:hypothetical protein